MKTSRILLFGLLLIGMSVQAQKIYVRAGLGSTVSTASSIVNDYTYSDSSYTLDTKKEGIGTGMPFVIAAGYKLNENFGFELGIDYFLGFPSKTKSVTQYSTTDSKLRGMMVSLVPAFVITFPINKIHPYARLGLKLGVMNSIVYENHKINSGEAGSDIQSKTRDYGGIAIGVQAAVGTDYALSGLISLFAEIQVNGISYSPTHGKFTEYNVDGVDQLSSRTVKENKWNYYKDVNLAQNIPDDQPNKVPRVNHQFGNVGLVVGIKFNFK